MREGTFSDVVASLMFARCTFKKGPYAICGQRRSKSACANAQADLGLRCPLTELMDILVYVDEQRMHR